MLLDGASRWFDLVVRLQRRRENYPEGVESEAIPAMFRDRTRLLRN